MIKISVDPGGKEEFHLITVDYKGDVINIKQGSTDNENKRKKGYGFSEACEVLGESEIQRP